MEENNENTTIRDFWNQNDFEDYNDLAYRLIESGMDLNDKNISILDLKEYCEFFELDIYEEQDIAFIFEDLEDKHYDTLLDENNFTDDNNF